MTRYQLGFLKKCASHKIDGRSLLKRAQARTYGTQEPPGGAYAPMGTRILYGALPNKDDVRATGPLNSRGAEKAERPTLAHPTPGVTHLQTSDGGMRQVSPSQLPAPAWHQRYGLSAQQGGALLGAGVTGLAALLHETLRRRRGKQDRKSYLLKPLVAALAGGAVGALSQDARVAKGLRSVGRVFSNT